MNDFNETFIDLNYRQRKKVVFISGRLSVLPTHSHLFSNVDFCIENVSLIVLVIVWCNEIIENRIEKMMCWVTQCPVIGILLFDNPF